ncbi:YceD family protein [Gilvimarinus sp. DA14]|uniref:YceD family protein n=1 Tax=Gilvimarinus sp. DA14 TaxID=2956798 RepID=UPI0020B7BEAB|nr:YceD family protein [Gilvimarinus sp. DA14]UTF60548.1 YceD family protein [Gilvimarinus sp. DA14]
MSQAPSSQSLPRRGDPRKYAQQGVELTGVLALEALPRLQGAVAGDSASFQVLLSFRIDEDGKKVLEGAIDGEVSMICQRCLDLVQVPLSCNLRLGIVWSEDQARALPRDLDPWVVGEGAADFYDIVEEELLLSLPAVAYHDYACVPSEHFRSEAPEAEVSSKPKQNPFQVLEQLKGTPKK